MQTAAYQTSVFVAVNVARSLEAWTLQRLPGPITVHIQNFTADQSGAAPDLNLDLKIQIYAPLFPVKVSTCRVTGVKY